MDTEIDYDKLIDKAFLGVVKDALAFIQKNGIGENYFYITFKTNYDGVKMPMILFNIPSLVPLVPGGQAYRAVRYFAIGKNDLALSYLVQVGMIAGSIAVGFFLAEFVSQVYFKIHGYSQQ